MIRARSLSLITLGLNLEIERSDLISQIILEMKFFGSVFLKSLSID
jgi:hypothetical protein